MKGGEIAQATVIDIKTSAKNSKWAIYKFVALEGEMIQARDIFQMYYIRPDKGDSLKMIYDVTKPQRLTADLGNWTWQGIIILGAGSLLFLFITIVILRSGVRQW